MAYDKAIATDCCESFFSTIVYLLLRGKLLLVIVTVTPQNRVFQTIMKINYIKNFKLNLIIIENLNNNKKQVENSF